jgi:hypothetical protein
MTSHPRISEVMCACLEFKAAFHGFVSALRGAGRGDEEIAEAVRQACEEEELNVQG